MLEDDVLRFLSNRDRISALLGLRVDFLDRLEDVPLEDRDHLTLCDWIVTFLRKNYESVGLVDKSCPSKELLASIGFDPLSSAVETIMARARNLHQHVDVCELAEIYIKDEFKYNLLLSPVTFRFPLQSHLKNSWFQPPRNIDLKEEVANQVWQVNILNFVTEESLAPGTICSKLSDLMSLKDGKTVVLFHGTDHQSACDILFRGIDLCQGRQKRDFSCGSGFYLTDNSEEALNWAKNTTAKPALLVFKVNRQEYLDHAEKLNLFENEQRWIEIVSSFRSEKKTAKTRKSLRAYDLIEGPVGRKRRNEVSDETVYDPKPSSYQMCLNSDDFADTFRKTLHSIIFLKICWGKLHTLQKEPPILCKETEFIFRGNNFSRRPRYAIELRVLRDARTRAPVPRTRVSYWEQLNNLTLRNWLNDHLSWSYKPPGTFIPVLVIHSRRNEIDSSSFSVGWLYYTRGGKTRICSTLSFHFPDQKINYELWVMSTSSRKSCLIEMQYVNWSCLHFVDTDWLHLRSKQMKENRNPEITKFFKICGDCFVKSFIIRLKICQAF